LLAGVERVALEIRRRKVHGLRNRNAPMLQPFALPRLGVRMIHFKHAERAIAGKSLGPRGGRRNQLSMLDIVDI